MFYYKEMIVLNSFTSDENIIDVEYEDADHKRIIHGEPLFFTTTQVSEMLSEEPSTIRYWSKRFEHLLDIQISNRNRQYKKSDIEKLRFIKKLSREDGLTLQQIEDYTSAKGFDINEIEKGIVHSSNPLQIQTIISAIAVEMEKKLESFADDLLSKVNEINKANLIQQQEMNSSLHEVISVTVDEIVTDKLSTLDSKFQEITNYLDTKEMDAKARDNEMIDILRRGQEQKSEQVEVKQGFLKKLFNKNK